jgi:hypothetical protein
MRGEKSRTNRTTQTHLSANAWPPGISLNASDVRRPLNAPRKGALRQTQYELLLKLHPKRALLSRLFCGENIRTRDAHSMRGAWRERSFPLVGKVSRGCATDGASPLAIRKRAVVCSCAISEQHRRYPPDPAPQGGGSIEQQLTQKRRRLSTAAFKVAGVDPYIAARRIMRRSSSGSPDVRRLRAWLG